MRPSERTRDEDVSGGKGLFGEPETVHPRFHPGALAPASERAKVDVIAAFDLLAHRGTGSHAWAAPFRDDPIAFILDTICDAANLWRADGALLYQNRAAASFSFGRFDEALLEKFSRGEHRFERRCLRFSAAGTDFVLEIIHQVPESSSYPP